MRAEMGGGGPPREVSNKVQPTEGARTPGGKTLGGDVPKTGIAGKSSPGKYGSRKDRSTGVREASPNASRPSFVRELDEQGRDGWKAWAESVQPGLEEKVRAAGITEDKKVSDVLTKIWTSFPDILGRTGRRQDIDVTKLMRILSDRHIKSARTGRPFDPKTVADQLMNRAKEVKVFPQKPKEPKKSEEPPKPPKESMKQDPKRPESKQQTEPKETGIGTEGALREDILKTLPPRQRAVLQLTTDGLTKYQIAEKLNIPINNISGWLFRARKTYDAHLAREAEATKAHDKDKSDSSRESARTGKPVDPKTVADRPMNKSEEPSKPPKGSMKPKAQPKTREPIIKEPLRPEVLANVPEKYRTVLALRETDNLSINQISEKLGMPPGTVANYLSFGRRAYNANIQGTAEVSDKDKS